MTGRAWNEQQFRPAAQRQPPEIAHRQLPEIIGLQRQLELAQNADGGWGYQSGASETGSSWTEPTALALLALQAHDVRNSISQRAYRWLCEQQRSDGGWPPHPSVPVSTWVTSLATLALSGNDDATTHLYARSIEWLVRQIQPEASQLERFIVRLRGGLAPLQKGGSPWFPGTAAWVGPSAMSILALSQAATRTNDPKLVTLIQQGHQYLLCHRCEDGGWNHGGSRYLSQNAASYPETTGLALLALAAVPAQELAVPLRVAEQQASAPGSLEALCWLRLALVRHGHDSDTIPDPPFPCRTTRDIALRLLSLATTSSNKLLYAIA